MTDGRLILRRVHRWAGAFVSLVLVILGLSGTLLVFKDDWLRASLPGAAVPVTADPAMAADAALAAERVFGAGAVRSIVLAHPGLGLHTVALADGSGAYLAPGGAVVDRWTGNGRPEAWLFDLHHRLLSGETGEVVVGATGLALVVLALTGLVITLPLRPGQLLALWPATRTRRDLLAAHRGLGLVLAGPLLVFALSGAAMVFDGPARALAGLLGGPATPVTPPVLPPVLPPGLPPGPAPARDTGSTATDWRAALTTAQALHPRAQLRVLVWPGAGRPLQIRLRGPDEWHPNGRTTVWLEPGSDRVLASRAAAAAPLGEQWYNALYPIHAARLGSGIGARAVDFAWAGAGLGLAASGLFGLWAFLVRPQRNPRKRPQVAAAG